MYVIGICDDGENFCSELENDLLDYAKKKDMQFDVKIWYTGEGLKDYLSSGGHLDVLFLDIELFKMTGIEVGQFIRNELDDSGLQLVYVSGKSSYALQLFKTQPLDFLIKPITKEQLFDAVDSAIKVIKKKQKRFEFQHGKDHLFVPQGNITYFETQGRKIKLVTIEGVFEFYGKLSTIVKNLSDDFIEIHQSYVINKTHVSRYTYEMIEMDNGDILTISQNKRKQVRNKILRGE